MGGGCGGGGAGPDEPEAPPVGPGGFPFSGFRRILTLPGGDGEPEINGGPPGPMCISTSRSNGPNSGRDKIEGPYGGGNTIARLRTGVAGAVPYP